MTIDAEKIRQALEKATGLELRPDFEVRAKKEAAPKTQEPKKTTEPKEQKIIRRQITQPGDIIKDHYIPGYYYLILSTNKETINYLVIYPSCKIEKGEIYRVDAEADPVFQEGERIEFSQLPERVQGEKDLHEKYLRSLVFRIKRPLEPNWQIMTTDERQRWVERMKPKQDEVWISEVRLLDGTIQHTEVRIQEVGRGKIKVVNLATNEEEEYPAPEFLACFSPKPSTYDRPQMRQPRASIPVKPPIAKPPQEPAEGQPEPPLRPAKEIPSVPEPEKEKITIQPADILKEAKGKADKYYLIMDSQQTEKGPKIFCYVFIIEYGPNQTYAVKPQQGVEELPTEVTQRLIDKIRQGTVIKLSSENLWDAVPEGAKFNNTIRKHFIQALINRFVAQEDRERYLISFNPGQRWRKKSEPQKIATISSCGTKEVNVAEQEEPIATQSFLQEFEPMPEEEGISAPVPQEPAEIPTKEPQEETETPAQEEETEEPTKPPMREEANETPVREGETKTSAQAEPKAQEPEAVEQPTKDQEQGKSAETKQENPHPQDTAISEEYMKPLSQTPEEERIPYEEVETRLEDKELFPEDKPLLNTGETIFIATFDPNLTTSSQLSGVFGEVLECLEDGIKYQPLNKQMEPIGEPEEIKDEQYDKERDERGGEFVIYTLRGQKI